MNNLPGAAGASDGSDEILEVSVLGPVRLVIARPGAAPRPVPFTEKEAAFVAYLAITGRDHPRGSLAELFWPERPPDQSLANLRVLLSRLRKKLDGFLVVARDVVGLAEGGVGVDLRRLTGALDALDALDAEPGAAAERALAALTGLEPGTLAAGASVAGSLAFDDWLDGERSALDRRLAAARVLLLELAVSRGDLEAALEHSAALVAADRLDEAACRRHMRLLARAGRRAEGLACFDACRRALAAELDIEPEDATVDLASALRDRRLPESGPRPSTNRLERRARTLLLDRVERFWLDQVLETAMPPGGAFRLLELERPDLVASSWSDLSVLPDVAAMTLVPSDEPLLVRFAQAGGALLIVGDPGGGKTFRLLELAREALAAARADADAPVPVVLHLGSWPSAGTLRLSGWLREELRARYHLPRGVAARWLERGALTLLLDGLDELALDARVSCVEAINRARGDTGLMAIAVCCRAGAYRQLVDAGARLRLETASELQPLTPWQIDRYLDAGSAHAPLARVFARDPGWRDLLANPLMLSLATESAAMTVTPEPVALSDTADGEVSAADLRHEVVGGYVDRMLARGAGEGGSPKRLMAGLRGLARGMAAHSQGVFQIEALQPSWLPSQAARIGYLLASRVAASAAIGGLLLVAGVLARADLRSVPIILAAVAIGALMLIGVDLGRSRHSRAGPLPTAARAGLALAVVAVLIVVGTKLARDLGGRADYGPVFFAATFASLLVWRPRRVGWHRDVEPVAALAWSPRRALRGLFAGALGGAACGAVTFSVFAPAGGASTLSALAGAAVGPMVTIAIIAAILTGLHETAAGDLEHPNVGIRVSLRSAIFGALMMSVGLGLGLLIAFRALGPLLEAFDIQPFFALRHSGRAPGRPVALAIAALLGGYAFLWYGGLEVLKHVILRVFLWRTGILPLRIARFLAAAAERGLLRHQASGTIFRHRAVLDHFAAAEENPAHPVLPAAEASASRGIGEATHDGFQRAAPEASAPEMGEDHAE